MTAPQSLREGHCTRNEIGEERKWRSLYTLKVPGGWSSTEVGRDIESMKVAYHCILLVGLPERDY